MAEQRADKVGVLTANQEFYRALSAGSLEGISAVCAQDADVTVLHEGSKEVAVGWPAVLATWKDLPFASFSELSVEVANPVINVKGPVAWAVGLEKIRGKMKSGDDFAWTALGTNIFEKRGDRWLMVHHHASKAAEEEYQQHLPGSEH
jgi:ketosteroid isomerase-like protein